MAKNRIGAGGPFLVTLQLPDFIPNNVGPQGSAAKTIIIFPNRAKLVWWADDEWVPFVVAPTLDEEYCVVNKFTPFAFNQYVPGDEDTLPYNIEGDDSGQIWTSVANVEAPYLVTAEDEWVPFVAAPVFDDEYCAVNRYSPYATTKPITADEDVWVPVIQFDDEYWLINRYYPYAVTQPFVSDEDIWVASIPVDEDYWLINSYKPYPPVTPFTSDEDVWVSSVFIVDDECQLINQYVPYKSVQPFTSDEDVWIASISFDEDYQGLIKAGRQAEFNRLWVNELDDWVPSTASPNLHRLVIDINTGRLGWKVSGSSTGSPIAVIFFS